MRPTIGIALCLDDRGRWKPARDYQYIDTAYARALTECGADAVYLPIQEPTESLMARIDGLLLPGGDDLPPPRGYVTRASFDLAPRRQIDFDRQLLAHALSRELPVLGICYGMQLMALHRGGSLLYDIPTDRPDAGSHRLPEPDGRHALHVEPGSQLAGMLGELPGPVNSAHHQAVDDPGEGMRVSARAVDGLVEAIEGTGSGFCVGVQWHPEKMHEAHRQRLFGAFTAACAAGAGGESGEREY